MTLELFQSTVDENGQLKDEVKRLRARLLCQDGEEVEGEGTDQDSSSSSSSGAALVQKVLKQEKELKDLREQVKALKTKGVQDEMAITKLTKSNSSNDALRKQLDNMMKEAAERDAAKEAAERDAAAVPTVEIHDHDECLQTITALNTRMQDSQSEFDSRLKQVEDETLKLSGSNSSLQTNNKALQEENTGLREQLEALERKYKEFQKAQDGSERALRDRIHTSELELVQLKHDGNAIEELRQELNTAYSEKSQLQLDNSDLAVQLRRQKERVRELENQLLELQEVKTNPLLLPNAAADVTATAAAVSTSQDSAFFLTMAQSTSTPRLGEHQSSSGGGGLGGFAEFVQLKKENKSLRAQLAKKGGGAMGLVGPAKGVPPGLR
jgi:myosin heavy subunit